MTREKLVRFLVQKDLIYKVPTLEKNSDGTYGIKNNEMINDIEKFFRNIYGVEILDDLKMKSEGWFHPMGKTDSELKHDFKKRFALLQKTMKGVVEDERLPETQRLIARAEFEKVYEKYSIGRKVKKLQGRVSFSDIREYSIEEFPDFDRFYSECPNCHIPFCRLPGVTGFPADRRIYCCPACKQEAFRARESHHCPICGIEYTRERSDKTTCGKDRCRKAYYRKHGTIRKKIQ